MGIKKQAFAKSWFEKLKLDEVPRKLSELGQLDKEDTYRMIVENAYEGIAIVQSSKLCFANKRLVELTGYSKQELLSKNFIYLIHPDDREKIIDRYSRRIRGESVTNTYPLRIVTKDGDINWILSTHIQIQWKGRPAILSFATDISSQKQVEEALKESEKRYRDIVDNAVVGIYETDINGSIIYINDAMIKIFEWESLEEAIGQNVAVVYKNIRDRDAFLEILKKNGHVKNFEIEFVTKTGRPKNAIVSAVLHGDKIFGMLLDVSEHKKSQEALNTLINATHDMALLIDLHGTVMAINKQAAETFKKNPDTLIGQCIYQFMPQTVAEYRRNWIKEVVVSKRPAQHIEQIQNQYYIANIFPISDSEGNVETLALFVKDITELKKAEEALRASEKRYRDIVENALAGVYETNLQGDILYVNDALTKIFEFDSPAAIIGTSAAVRYKDKKVRKVFIEKLKRNGKVENFEFEAVTQAGKTKNVNISAVLDGDKICGMIMDISDLKEAEKALQKAHDKLERRVAKRTKELKRQTQHLEEVNTALKVLLEKRNEDKNEMEEKILNNVKELILPYLEKVKRKVTDKKLHTYLSVLETNLTNIISPFSNKLSSKYMNLTTSEIKVADLVKHGKRTKEIADLLNVSVKTVETHRVNIRKKLGLTNKRANLRTYLLSIENG